MMKELSDLLLGWTNYFQTKNSRKINFAMKRKSCIWELFNPLLAVWRVPNIKELKVQLSPLQNYVITLGGWVYPHLPTKQKLLNEQKKLYFELFNLLLAVWPLQNYIYQKTANSLHLLKENTLRVSSCGKARWHWYHLVAITK